MRTIFATLVVLVSLASEALAQPPAVGPRTSATAPPCLPSQPARCPGEFSASLIANMVRVTAQLTVDETNTRFRQQDRSARVSIESLQLRRPSRVQTDQINRPNEWIIRFPFTLTLKVDIPGFDRRIVLPIDVDAACNNWHTRNGKVVFRSRPGPASFEGGNILEDVFNVGSFIDGQVRAGFSPPLQSTTPIPLNGDCVTVGLGAGDAARPEDTYLYWLGPLPPGPDTGPVAGPLIEVTFNRVKRLRARTFNSEILYRASEDFRLNLFANFSMQQKRLTMREDEDVALDLPTITLDGKDYDTLVVLGHVDQSPFEPKDSAFAVATRAQDFRPGTHVLQIPKWFSRPPDSINRRPTLLSRPAYEVAYTVRFVNAGTVGPAGPSTTRPPVGPRPGTVIGPAKK